MNLRLTRQRERLLAPLALLTLGIFTCSCGGGGGSAPPAPPPPPSLAISTASLPDGITGQPYSQTLQATNGTPPYTWSLTASSPPLPAGLSLSSAGVISGTPSAPYMMTIFVRVQDAAAQSATRNLDLAISEPLSIATSTPPDGNVGLSFGPISLSAVGGRGVYSWTLAQGSNPLPPGLNLSVSGQISGTPTAPGTFNFTVSVTDGGNPKQTATRSLSINIRNELYILSSRLPDGVITRPYSATLSAVGGTLPYTWSLTAGSSLPPGLSLDATAGVVSGTPTATGSASFNLTVTDSSSPPKVAAAGVLLIIQPLLQIITTSLPDAIRTRDYFGQVDVSGGISPYTARIAAGSLPPGLSLPSGTFPSPMNITGRPTTTGNFSLTLEVADSSSPPLTATKDFTMRVNDPLTITPAAIPEGLEGTPFSVTFAASGGVPPYSWQSGSSLPAGLGFDPLTATLSGTPTEAFNSVFVIQLSDSGSPPQFVTQSFGLRIVGKLAITTTQLPRVAVNGRLEAFLSMRGGTTPLTWSVVSGSLPAGLSLDASSGRLHGMPTGAETQTFTVRLADSGVTFPQSVEQTLTLTILAAPGRNDSTATATLLSNGTYRASLSPADDASGATNPEHDFYAITANPGTIVTVEITAERLAPPSPADSVIEIVDINGVRYTSCSDAFMTGSSSPCLNDDNAQVGTLDSKLLFQVPGTPGGAPVTFYVRVLDWSGMARPDFVYTIAISGAN